MSELQQEATDLLARLIRFNTVNPPGNERPLQEHLASYLSDAGMDVSLLGRTDERPNLVARLRGDRPADGPTLCLLSHCDTVLAKPEEWERDPWSGDVVDGFLWGRGALDMKSQTAAEAVAVAALARSGWRPARGELILVCVVDEERGGGEGARWLTATHPDAVRCDMLVNEGAGEVFGYDGRRLYGVCCAEKGVFRFRLTTDGVAAHASIPALGDNALAKMAPLIERLSARQPAYDLTPVPQAFLEALGERVDSESDVEGALARVREHEPRLAPLVEPMLGVTVSPTRIRASEKINVIPSAAELEVDCRVPPGLGEDEARRRVVELLGEDGYRMEFMERVPGNSSPFESELMDAIRGWVAEADPDATCVPVSLPGFTDSTTFRAAFPECVAYGFFPQRHMTRYETAPLIHGANERIDVRDLGFAARFFHDLPQRVLA